MKPEIDPSTERLLNELYVPDYKKRMLAIFLTVIVSAILLGAAFLFGPNYVHNCVSDVAGYCDNRKTLVGVAATLSGILFVFGIVCMLSLTIHKFLYRKSKEMYKE